MSDLYTEGAIDRLTAAVLAQAVAYEKQNGVEYPTARDNVLYAYQRMLREVSDD